MMFSKTNLELGSIICIIGLLIYFGFVVFSFNSFFNAFETFDLKKNLIDNYNKKQAEILELKSYFNSIVPKGKKVEIEFENENKLSRLDISSIDSASGRINYPIFLEWDLRTNSNKVDSIIRTIGWTQKTLRLIKEKLYKSNCIQIESGEPTKIGFQRSGMGMYFYNVFDQPIPDSLKQQYNDSCTYILYKDKLALEYGGGAVGPQCFSKINNYFFYQKSTPIAKCHIGFPRKKPPISHPASKRKK